MLVDDAQTTLIKFVDDQSTNKLVKSVSIMIVQKIIVMSNAEHFNKILLNENTEINVINYRYAIAHDMTSINSDLSISSHVKKKSMHCYDAYSVRIRLVDSWKQKRVFETMLYVLNKNEMSNMIFELSKLKQIETKLNYQMFIWRYEFSKQVFKSRQQTISRRKSIITTLYTLWWYNRINLIQKLKLTLFRRLSRMSTILRKRCLSNSKNSTTSFH
jgi:hypothetical protein